MIIKSLKLQNFRQFYGKQSIHFSVDADKKVTVILGNNTAGKTTIIEAFRWCFYCKLNLPHPLEIFNKMAGNLMKPYSEEDVSVEVCFVHSGIEYTVKTSQTFSKDEDDILIRKTKTPEQKIYKKLDGNLENITEYTQIDSIFPEDLMIYLFFTGERLKQLIDQSSIGQKDIRYAVQNVLGLKPIEESLSHLKGVSQAFQRDYHIGSSEQMTKFQSEKEKIDKTLNRLRNDEVELSSEIETMNKDLDDIIERLTRNASKDSGETLKKLQSEKDFKTNQLGEFWKKLGAFNKNYLPNYISRKIYYNNEARFQFSSKNSDEIIDKRLIKAIIDSGKCICGEEIHPGDEHYRNLISLTNDVCDMKISLSIQAYLDRRNSFFDFSQSYLHEVDEKISEIFNTNSTIQACLVSIEDIKQTLVGKEKYQDIKGELDKQNLKIQEKNEKIGALRTDIGINEKETQALDKKIDEIARTDENNKLIFLRKEYSDKLYQEIENYYRIKEERIKSDLTERVQKYYIELMGNNSKIFLNDDYTFMVKDIDGATGTSDGQDVITSFAFIGGIIDLAKTQVDEFIVSEPYPLIMDAPFALLDKEHKERSAKKMPDLCEQFILFSVSEQYSGVIQTALSNRIGKEYNIVMHSVSDVEKYSKIVEVL